MAERDEKLKQILLKLEQHSVLYTMLFFGVYIFLNNTLNATSEWMEIIRHSPPQFDMWEPFVWEYTSATSTLLLLPLLLKGLSLINKLSPHIVRQTIAHFALATLFAVAHVTLMVTFREVAYQVAGGNYDFGPILREFVYEYRKDVWGYLFFVTLYYLTGFLVRRVKGEASLIAQLEDNPQAAPRHFLVKKLDKAFLVRTEQIAWLEASGNYVNLHAGGRIYPLRATLTSMSEKLATQHFVRVHRSFAVNLEHIESISFEESGDGLITLKNNETVPLSRRYRSALDSALLT